MNSLATLLLRRDFGLLVLILGITGIASLLDPNFLHPDNLKDILVRSAPVAIVACGVMLVIVTGEIDISVGALMALLAALLGILISDQRLALPATLGIPITLLAGTAVGLVTGTLVTLGRVPSIIATLGLLTALRGATTWIMAGRNIDGLPSQLGHLTKYGIGGLPISVWTAAFVVALTGTLITHTPLGRRLFAVGSSPYSATMAGLSSTRLKLFAFGYTGFLTALATIVDVPRLPVIESGIGNGFELLVVTCVVVGGVSISGGRGQLRGVLLAVLLLALIRPALTFIDLGQAGERWARALQGLLIILAVITDSLIARRHRKARA